VQTDSDGAFLDAAARIGRRLMNSAVWSGRTCTWYVSVPDRNSPSRPSKVKTLAGTDLYQGAAGIALFLAELWRFTGDRSTRECAEAALRFSVEQRESAAVRGTGLYCGEGGIAYVAWRFSEIFRSDEWAAASSQVVSGLTKLLATDSGLDVISGAAGMVLALLRMQSARHDQQALRLALDAGARLSATAKRQPIGWSWNTGGRAARQNLCGYAHGASGIAHAFLELFAHTGDHAWSFAAKRALEYERRHRLENVSDWPDFRSANLSLMLAEPGGAARLRSRLRSGEAAPTSGEPVMRAWCHGAPGIALTRIRAVTLGADVDDCSLEARASVDMLIEDLERSSLRGYALCHGTFGNAETILTAEQRLGYAPRPQIQDVARAAVETYEMTGSRWPSGLASQEAEPSLMLGDAGIGHFILRLVEPAIPSVLCISDWRPVASTSAGDCDLRRAELGKLLPTLDPFLERWNPSGSFTTRVTALIVRSTSIASAVDELRRISGEATGENDSIRFIDALTPEFERIRDQHEFIDYAAQFCFELRQPRLVDIDWVNTRFRLAPSTRFVRTRWAWQKWLKSPGRELCDEPEAFMLFRERREVQSLPMTALATLIVESLSEPRSIAEVCMFVQEQVELVEANAAALARFVGSTIRRAVAMHAVCVCDAAADQ
jgi:hypothetical protein